MEGGPSRRVGANGIVIGRARDCDIVITDPSVSRRHVLIRLTAAGAEAVPLGRTGFQINNRTCEHARPLAHADRLALPGLVLVIELATTEADHAAPTTFRLERARGGSFGIIHSPFSIGGAEGDDLIIKRWPASVVRLHVAQDELFVEATTRGATRNGNEVVVDTTEQLVAGDAIRFRNETFTVHRDLEVDATTVVGHAALPKRVVVELLPRGGRVVFVFDTSEHAVYLADRRLDLMVALLRPPDGFRAGDYIPDDVVRAVVWPRNPDVTRPEINSLISRCRRDLVEAGISGHRLLERSPGGGGTRLAIAPDAEIVVVG